MAERILYLYAAPYRSDSGHARRSIRMIDTLSALGYEVDLLTLPSAEAWPVAARSVYTTARLPFLETLPMYRPGFRRMLSNIFLFFKAIHLDLRHHYTVVHSCDQAVTVGRWISWFIRSRFIIEWRSRPGRSISAWRRSPFRRGILRSAALIISDESCALNEAKRCHCSDRLAYIPSVSSIAPGAPPAPAAPPPDGVEDVTPFHITTLASHSGFAGLEAFLDAIPEIIESRPNVFIHIAGGRPAAVRKLQTRLEACFPDWVERIELTGPLPPQRLATLLEDSDLLYARRADLCHPPMSLLDEMAAARPIVAADSPANRTLLTPATARIVPDDYQAVARAVIELIHSPRQRAAYAEAALAALTRDRTPLAFQATLRSCYAYALENQPL